jgi:AhpD family alkylhydroperoxidase
MESKELKARIFTTKDFYKHLKIVVNNFSAIRKSIKSGNVSKAFSEKTMLAVTQVNGCRLCSYVHTKSAIDAGASEEDIKLLLNGELGELNTDESLALMFAQHYADTDGNPDKETYEKFVEHYGEQKAADILANIRVIMAANIHGIAIDALQSQVKGKKMNGSKLSNELGISLGILVLLPVAFIQVGFEKLFKNKTENNINKKQTEMKTIKNVSVVALLIALLISSGASYAQNSGVSTDYNVMSRLDQSPRPAGFQPTKATPVNGAYTESVATSSNRVLNEETIMLKKVSVQPIGDDDFSTWQFLCDEGGHTYEQSSPNPLSYMTGGISSSLLTRVEQAIKIMDLDVASAKVETKVFFRYDDPFSPKWTGFTDKVIANILIESDEPAEKITELKRMAVQAWAVGECIMKETPVDAQYAYNTTIWETESARHGKVAGADSYDNGMKITSKGNKLAPKSFELGADVGMEKWTNPFVFAVVSISESANDAQRPYLHKVKIRALQENYVTWDVYTDDSRGFEGTDKAPSSRDYFTAGTSLCLMSQLTGWSEMYKRQGIEIDDYRVEQQFNYQVDNYMTPSATGHVDGVTTRILIKSDANEKVMSDFATNALRTCFAGEAVLGATTTEIDVFQNGKLVKE